MTHPFNRRSVFSPFKLLTAVFFNVMAAFGGLDPLQFSETPPSSGFFTASVTNEFDGIGVGLADDWTLEAEGNSRLTVRLEATEGNSRPKLRVLTPSSQTVASADGGTSGIVETYNLLLSAPGTYRVRVYTDHQLSGYRLRVDLSRGPSLESEPNNSTNEANALVTTQLGGTFRLQAAGALPVNDTTGDFFSLETLDSGNTINSSVINQH